MQWPRFKRHPLRDSASPLAAWHLALHIRQTERRIIASHFSAILEDLMRQGRQTSMVSQFFPGRKPRYLWGAITLRITEYCTSAMNSYFLTPQSVYIKASRIMYTHRVTNNPMFYKNSLSLMERNHHIDFIKLFLFWLLIRERTPIF